MKRFGSSASAAAMALVTALAMAPATPGVSAEDPDVDVVVVAVDDLAQTRGQEILVLERGPERPVAWAYWNGSAGYGRRLILKELSTGATIWSQPLRDSLWVGTVDLDRRGRDEVAVLELPDLTEHADGVSHATTLRIRLLRSDDEAAVWATELPLPSVNATATCLPSEVMAGSLGATAYPIGDVSGDGDRDLLVTGFVGVYHAQCALVADRFGRSGRHMAWVVSGSDGELISSFTGMGGEMRPVMNLDGRGLPRLVEYGAEMIARALDGTVLWIARIETGFFHLVELDGDPGKEILSCDYPNSSPDPAEPARCWGDAIDGDDGSTIWRTSQQEQTFFFLAGDLNRDGIDDFLVTGCPGLCDYSTTRALSGRSLERLWSRKHADISGPSCCADLDGDRVADHLDGRSSNEFTQGGRKMVKTWIYARSGIDGRVIWTRLATVPSEGALPFYLAGGDVDGDRGGELLTAAHVRATQSIKLRLFDGSTGEALWMGSVAAPARAWYGRTQVARSRGRGYLIMEVTPAYGEEPLTACRIHVLSREGRAWSYPRC